MKIKKNSEFITVESAAQLAGISHWTVRLWLRLGRLTRYKSASRTVISRKEVLELTKPTPVEPKAAHRVTTEFTEGPIAEPNTPKKRSY